ncbi:uncharacterized protein BX664DRAFT_385060 [Halteromyces radiatus]|uniref:uncharacterized protein n=1 Tax=Halteromyces radiatus TaxID=101107 RepID=UPI0022210DF0|nr:uncharacterized protein BX664DRAFT_385060 [Halteromyces radiatus]KAI8093668.1 hypothetical protein BX664DRAFT_385060 [Halteromyces radiatus]
MSDHTKFISTYYSTGEPPEQPDLFYQYNHKTINVYSRLQKYNLISKITTEDLLSISDEQTLTIQHVLDATFRHEPILVIVTSIPLKSQNTTIHVFWHNINSKTTRPVLFDLPVMGDISLISMTCTPLNLVKEDIHEILMEGRLRHLLVFGKRDQSVQAALLYEDQENVRGKVTEIHLPSKVSGDITAIHILPQNAHDLRFGFSDPRILVGTSKGHIQILRLIARLQKQTHKRVNIVTAQTLTEFANDDKAPITYLKAVHAPVKRKMVIAVVQTHHPLPKKKVSDHNQMENPHIRVCEWFGNSRRKFSERLVPTKLDSYTILATRIIPTTKDYRLAVVFQSTKNKQHVEVDVWSVKTCIATLIASGELIESDPQNIIQDIWPIKGTDEYILLSQEKLIESGSSSLGTLQRQYCITTGLLEEENNDKIIRHSTPPFNLEMPLEQLSKNTRSSTPLTDMEDSKSIDFNYDTDIPSSPLLDMDQDESLDHIDEETMDDDSAPFTPLVPPDQDEQLDHTSDINDHTDEGIIYEKNSGNDSIPFAPLVSPDQDEHIAVKDEGVKDENKASPQETGIVNDFDDDGSDIFYEPQTIIDDNSDHDDDDDDDDSSDIYYEPQGEHIDDNKDVGSTMDEDKAESVTIDNTNIENAGLPLDEIHHDLEQQYNIPKVDNMDNENTTTTTVGIPQDKDEKNMDTTTPLDEHHDDQDVLIATAEEITQNNDDTETSLDRQLDQQREPSIDHVTLIAAAGDNKESKDEVIPLDEYRDQRQPASLVDDNSSTPVTNEQNDDELIQQQYNTTPTTNTTVDTENIDTLSSISKMKAGTVSDEDSDGAEPIMTTTTTTIDKIDEEDVNLDTSDNDVKDQTHKDVSFVQTNKEQQNGTTSFFLTAPSSPAPSSSQRLKNVRQYTMTPKEVYRQKVEKVTHLSMSDGLNMVRKDEQCEFKQEERFFIFLDIFFTAGTKLDIEKSITALEDMELDMTEEDWLMRYCFEHEDPLMKLLIMRYNVKHEQYGLVMLQNDMMKQRKQEDGKRDTDHGNKENTLIHVVDRTCNNLANISQTMTHGVLQDLPLIIFGRPRGKVGNPFVKEQEPNLLKRKGLHLGADLINQVLDKKRRKT